MNNFNITGRITKEPELRKTTSNLSVCYFTLAVNKKFKKDQEQEADFLDFVVWRQGADYLCKYAQKGALIAVTGNITTYIREKDGKQDKQIQLLVDNLEILHNNNSSNAKNKPVGAQNYQGGINTYGSVQSASNSTESANTNDFLVDEPLEIVEDELPF